VQDLIGLPHLPFRRLKLVQITCHVSRNTGTFAAVHLNLVDKLVKRLRDTADLRGNRYYGGPVLRVVDFVVQHDLYRSKYESQMKTRSLLIHNSQLSQELGPWAIQCGSILFLKQQSMWSQRTLKLALKFLLRTTAISLVMNCTERFTMHEAPGVEVQNFENWRPS
jgi:hypothetical protein